MKHSFFKGMMALLISTSLMVHLNSCQPDNTEPDTCTNGIMDGDETGVDCGGSCEPCEVLTGKVRSVTVENSVLGGVVLMEEYGYDGQGRIVWVYVNNYDTLFYSHGPGVAYITTHSPQDTVARYVLNNDGLAISNDDEVSFRYDNGYMTWLYHFNGDSVNSVYSNGNMVQEITYEDGTPVVRDFTYYPELDNRNVDLRYQTWVGHTGTFYGKWSKNLKKTMTMSGNPLVGEYTYNFDGAGRVMREVLTIDVDSFVNTYTYY